eukprot:6184490-Pleurochrysis_carterae.AAC.1
MTDAAPLELEHMLGFAATRDSAVFYHPTQPDVMVMYTGCLVIIGSVSDPHQQEFLHGHTEEITCISVSPSGNLIASGQTCCTRVPNSEAMVIVWDFKTRRCIYVLNELHNSAQLGRCAQFCLRKKSFVCPPPPSKRTSQASPTCVERLSFSPDDHYLAGSDDQQRGAKLCVWDMENGSLANVSKQPTTLSFLCWGAVVASTRKMSRHDQYKLFGACGARVFRFWLEFDVRAGAASPWDHECTSD